MNMHYRKLLVRHVLFHMDEATSANDLAKQVNVLDAIMWLKSAWDSVQPTTIQKCFQKCGFAAVSLSEGAEDNPVVDSDLQVFTENVGMTWDEYANFDADLATYETVEKDWEDKLLDRVIARHQGSTISSDEEDIDDGSGPTPIVSAVMAVGYLDQLRDFALAHQNPELLEYISKSKAIVEYSMCKKLVKQTKLTDYFD